MKNAFFAVLFFSLGYAGMAGGQIITTYAGNGTAGYMGDGTPATAAEMNSPSGVAVDAHGNLYIADNVANVVRKVNQLGIITTMAGTGTGGYGGDGGPATDALLNFPLGVAVDATGNIYISDTYNERIRKVDTFGMISTFAGTGVAGYTGDWIAATASKINYPEGIFVDSLRNIYFADHNNYRVRKVDTSGIITTVAGTGMSGWGGDGGPATDATVTPNGVAVDAGGNIYVSSPYAQRIRRVQPSGIISIFAGTGTAGFTGDGGPATSAQVYAPEYLTVDTTGNIYFCDLINNRVRMIDTSGIIRTFAGSGATGTGTGSYGGDEGPATDAHLNNMWGIGYDKHTGSIYIADVGNARVRKVTRPSPGALEASMPHPCSGITVFPNPASGVFAINIQSNTVATASVALTDMVGRRVDEFICPTNKPTMRAVNAPSGIYIISAIAGGESWESRLVIKRE